jgi:carboxylesterase type B
MYWIHGGAFTTGSGSLSLYDGTKLAQKEVVVVSINYRLGMMGNFIAPGMYDDDFCVPNRGFLDQVAGLRWVKENIKHFGGNPDNVTIFGESAGGQSVTVLLASPTTKGLFQRAIAQSGTPELGVPISDHERFAIDLLDAMGLEKGSRAALSGLSAKDTVDAAKIARKLISKGSEEKYSDLVNFGNVGCIYGDDFLPLSILESLKQGQGKDIELMIGTVLEDGRLFPLVMPGPESFSSWMCMRVFKGMFKPKNEPKLVFDRYKKVMPGASKIAIRGQILTDCLFRRGSVKAAEVHSAANPGRTYLYQFNWSSPVLNGAIGAMHGIDIPFANQNLDAFSHLLGGIEPLRGMADAVSDAWVNFAKTGKPSSSNLPEWEPFETEKRATMVFNTASEVQYDVDKEMREIWDG